jgi:hypothetical protein
MKGAGGKPNLFDAGPIMDAIAEAAKEAQAVCAGRLPPQPGRDDAARGSAPQPPLPIIGVDQGGGRLTLSTRLSAELGVRALRDGFPGHHVRMSSVLRMMFGEVDRPRVRVFVSITDRIAPGGGQIMRVNPDFRRYPLIERAPFVLAAPAPAVPDPVSHRMSSPSAPRGPPAPD